LGHCPSRADRRARRRRLLLLACSDNVLEGTAVGKPSTGQNREKTVSRFSLLRRPILLGQVFLVSFLVVSISLHPGFVFKGNEGGISNYGIHLWTAIPYTVAFALGALFTLKAARTRTFPSVARIGLLVYAVLLFMTLFSTYVYKLNYGLKLVHVSVAVALVSFEVLASTWSCLRVRSRGAAALFAVVIVGFIVAGLTFIGAAHLLVIGQALTTLGFAGLLIRTESALQGDLAGAPCVA
jgi:hypothetical protein